MKLEVGMFVRTKEGNIEKICAIENTHIYTDEDYLSWYGNYNAFSKASNNIIDLIEEGDYVNGTIVTTKTPNKYIELDYSYNRKGCYEEDIKTVVTKEQFESMQYKVD